MSQAKPKKPRGKQHDVRAASFLRMAEAIEEKAQTIGGAAAFALIQLAGILRDESELLRAMR